MLNNLNNKSDISKIYGANYFEPDVKFIKCSLSNDLYYYKCFIGDHTVEVEAGDCVYWISDNGEIAYLERGPSVIKSKNCATVIRGYMPENKSCEIKTMTTLPYINGCSTKQIFPAERLGDPTLQMLYMPPFTSEQAHHIHSTVRVVYVKSGQGYSIVGMEDKSVKEELYRGKVIVLEKMCPHHFVTENQPLTVVPLHVWSSVQGMEHDHPMFNGTHQIG